MIEAHFFNRVFSPLIRVFITIWYQLNKEKCRNCLKECFNRQVRDDKINNTRVSIIQDCLRKLEYCDEVLYFL